MPHIAPLIAALSIAETLDLYTPEAEQPFKIKWINDVYHGDKKLSGVLCTCSNIDGARFLSLGLGVNLNFSPI